MIKIHKSTAKKTFGQFYVTIQSKNGKTLMVSETFKQVASAIKNIRAVQKVFDGEFLDVLDCTGRENKKIVL